MLWITIKVNQINMKVLLKSNSKPDYKSLDSFAWIAVGVIGWQVWSYTFVSCSFFSQLHFLLFSLFENCFQSFTCMFYSIEFFKWKYHNRKEGFGALFSKISRNFFIFVRLAFWNLKITMEFMRELKSTFFIISDMYSNITL